MSRDEVEGFILVEFMRLDAFLENSEYGAGAG